ncbi:zinc finger BED domain-containing protein RICESLEEPER 2-like [Silene latifolia]|uniref:zinc finger BED domain-containing protein RICESLEEPER 2-like n=1 Tax=Silene latifolia TaxID=37657 RepID=UPI003D773FBD
MTEPSEPTSPFTRPIVEEYFVNVDDEMEIEEEMEAQVTEEDTHPHLNSTEDVLAEESPLPHPFKRERKAKVWKDFLDPTLVKGICKSKCKYCDKALSHLKSGIFSILVDNVSANDTCIQVLKDTFSLTKRLLCDGKLFHVRRCAHILNIMVQHGLKEVKTIISNVHESVDYINQSDLRLKKFTELVQQFNLKERRLVLECKTRWNSTYEMLACVIKFKKVFARLAQADRSYTYCPSAEDWVKIEKLSEILEVFNDTTNIISGSEYPTSNLFLAEIYRIKVLLDTQLVTYDEFVKKLVKKMKERFDKYWGQCNLLMAIGAVLDPRLKMKVVEIIFPKMFPSDDGSVARDNVNKVRETLYELYKEYVTMYSPTGQSDEAEGSSSMSIRSNTPGLSELLRVVRSEDTIESRKSEVDDYLEEGCYVPHEDECFDALAWWKDKSMKFPIISAGS